MLIRLSRRTAVCQSVTEAYLTDVAPLGAASHRFSTLGPNVGNPDSNLNQAILLLQSDKISISPFSI